MNAKKPATISHRKSSPMGATVADVMTQVVVTVTPETPIDEAIELFTQRHITGAPVVSKDGRVLGVVSVTDVLRNESSDHETAYYLEDELSGSMRRIPPSRESRTVLDIATRKVVSIDENASLPEAAKILFELGIRRLLVTRHGKFAGILSATDIVKWVARPVLEAEMT
jgi:CBS domain-containing protein